MGRRPRPVTWVREHPRGFDWIVAVSVLVLEFLAFVGAKGGKSALGKAARPADVLGAALVVAGCVPLIARRRRPVVVLVIAVVTILAYQNIGYVDAGITISSLIAAYSVGAYAPDRRTVVRVAAVLLGALTIAELIAIWTEHRTAGPLATAFSNVIIFGTAFIVGDNVRRRRERIAHLEERALANEREHDMLARHAVVDEQRRIARELHDVIAHSLSVMVVQAGAARRIVTKKPEQAEEAIAAIETTGRAALAEMRQLLGVLRGEDLAAVAEVAPQPTLERIAELVHADPGLDVGLRVEGDAIALPAAVDVQAYRIVQEALTNVRKHAGPAHADVTVRYRPSGVQVVVSDNGRGAGAGLSANGSPMTGHGLLGMRERVALCNGTLHAGPRRGGGWVVDAFLPVTTTNGSPAAPTTTAASIAQSAEGAA